MSTEHSWQSDQQVPWLRWEGPDAFSDGIRTWPQGCELAQVKAGGEIPRDVWNLWWGLSQERHGVGSPWLRRGERTEWTGRN